MSSPTNVNFDDLIPQPKPDTFNIEWQGSTAVADLNSPGQQVRDVSGCYRVPQVGGVLVLTADYQVSVTDSGLLLVANSASPLTFTMPAIIPSLKTGQGVWNVSIKNIGTGALTVDPNGLNLDGSASTVSLAQGDVRLGITTDGTGYYTADTGGAVTFADEETPSGSINGSNTSFSLAHTPKSGTLKLYLDGVRLHIGSGNDYTLSGSTITTAIGPATGSSLIADYRY